MLVFVFPGLFSASLPHLWLRTDGVGLVLLLYYFPWQLLHFEVMWFWHHTSTSWLLLKLAVGLISKGRNLELLSSINRAWSPIFRPKRPSLPPMSVQMAFCIMWGLEPSVWDSFGQSPSWECQRLCATGDGLEMLSVMKGLLLKSTWQFASGSECFLGRVTSDVHSSFNRHFLSSRY